MNEFLSDLCEILERHNATIVRSEKSDQLVASVMPRNGEITAEEVAFPEDISIESIRNGWHEPVCR